MTNEGDVLDYVEMIGHGKPILHKAAPFIAVPTTSGTGSEVRDYALALGAPCREPANAPVPVTHIYLSCSSSQAAIALPCPAVHTPPSLRLSLWQVTKNAVVKSRYAPQPPSTRLCL